VKPDVALTALARDLMQRAYDNPAGFFLVCTFDELVASRELTSQGLADCFGASRTEGAGTKFYRLTDKGWEVARVVCAA
jgi:hypothetical protein